MIDVVGALDDVFAEIGADLDLDDLDRHLAVIFQAALGFDDPPISISFSAEEVVRLWPFQNRPNVRSSCVQYRPNDSGTVLRDA